MHYVLDPPNRIHANIWIITVRDLDGSLLGCITRKEATNTSSTKEARFWFEDCDGKRLGEIRNSQDQFGLEVHGPAGEMKGKIKQQGTSKSSQYSDHHPFDSLTLEDASGRPMAMSDLFVFGDQGKFEYLRKSGLDIKTLSGGIVANVHGARSSSGLQVDLCSSSMDRLSILALIAVIVS